jgi:hypothetical protein
MSSSVLADWTYITRSDDSFTYADFSTLKKTGNTATIWELIDYETAGRHRYLSLKSQFQYDCLAQTVTGLFYISYADNMGEGRVIESFQPPYQQPVPIIPQSPEQTIWQLICTNH